VDRSAFAKGYLDQRITQSNLLQPVVPTGGLVRVVPKSMRDIHEGSAVTIRNEPASDTVTAVGVEPPNGVRMSGFKNKYDPGARVTFTAQVQQFQDGRPLFDPDTGLPVYAPQTFTGHTTGPIIDGQATVQIDDPSLLPFIRPGSSMTVDSDPYEETQGVVRVEPTDGPPTHFWAPYTRIFNTGSPTRVGYSTKGQYDTPLAVPADTRDPDNPGPRHHNVWNTRDNHGYNNPVVFYSVID
jgi:hypothetical protein